MTIDPWEFIDSHTSMMIASSDKKAHPHCSYAPFVRDEQKFYICLSGMAKHNKNIRYHDALSIMFIEDEASCDNLMARKRVTFDVVAKPIGRETEIFTNTIERFRDKIGEHTDIYESLPDFQLFELAIVSGRAVYGFGQAYDFKEGSF